MIGHCEATAVSEVLGPPSGLLHDSFFSPKELRHARDLENEFFVPWKEHPIRESTERADQRSPIALLVTPMQWKK
jgi:hypothetical protein